MEDRLKQLQAWQRELADIHYQFQKDRRNRELKDKKIILLKKALKSFEEEKEIPLWMIKFKPETILFAEFFGHYTKETGLTTSQIRNFFGAVRKLQMKVAQAYAVEEAQQVFPEETGMMMLVPRLSYAAARASKTGTNELNRILTIAINSVMETSVDSEKIKRFDNFTNFVEAIIAYHKTAGGE